MIVCHYNLHVLHAFRHAPHIPIPPVDPMILRALHGCSNSLSDDAGHTLLPSHRAHVFHRALVLPAGIASRLFK